jgi:CubicO group peptidase (beta-lactamase class C family)
MLQFEEAWALTNPNWILRSKQLVDVFPTIALGTVVFTGTYAWADPDSGLLYVFLSNRTYPTMDNNKLGDEDIRTKIQGLAVDAIQE